MYAPMSAGRASGRADLCDRLQLPVESSAAGRVGGRASPAMIDDPAKMKHSHP